MREGPEAGYKNRTGMEKNGVDSAATGLRPDSRPLDPD